MTVPFALMPEQEKEPMGLLGSVAGAQPRPSLLDRVVSGASRILGVPGGLSPEDTRVAQRSALTAAGTSLLQSTAPTRGGRSFLADLGTAIESGQQGAAQGLQMQDALRARQAQQQQAQLRQSILQRNRGSDSPTVLQDTLSDFVLNGDFEAAAAVGQAVQALEGGKLMSIDLGDRIQLVNPTTGEVVRTVEKGTEEGQNLTEINALLGRFQQAATQESTVAGAYRKILATANDPTPAGNLALLFGFMKVLDPTSVVRESEFAAAARAGSLPTQIQGFASQIISGQRLTDSQVADFLRQAGNLARASRDQLQVIREDFGARATRNGLNPADVTIDFFRGIVLPGDEGAASGQDTARDILNRNR